MKQISIIGFGRFGKTLFRLLKDDFSLVLFDKNPKAFEGFKSSSDAKVARSLAEIYKSDTIFFAVPINKFEAVIKSHQKYFRDSHLLVDALSVKMHPEKVFRKFLKDGKTQALLTHPMFGPDSSKNGFAGLPLIMDKFTSSEENYKFWKDFFENKGLRVIDMSARKHDQLAAGSQGLTHFIGRLLEQYKFVPTAMDSVGSKKLHEVVEQTCNDSWELFLNLQNFNPYTKKMRLKLGDSYDHLYNKLLPKRVDSKNLIFGIQGGVGSFNEQAVLHYLESHKLKSFKIKYLFTSKRVLSELHAGNIDFGQFAIHNSIGGIVGESIEAMAKYKFQTVEEFAIPIQHFLMKLPETSSQKLETIMAHPQVFAQCKTTLKDKFSHYKLVSGHGDLIDTAKSAQALSQRKLPKTTAILGPKILAKLYNLEIIAENLQDDKTNNTSFLLVKR